MPMKQFTLRGKWLRALTNDPFAKIFLANAPPDLPRDINGEVLATDAGVLLSPQNVRWTRDTQTLPTRLLAAATTFEL